MRHSFSYITLSFLMLALLAPPLVAQEVEPEAEGLAADPLVATAIERVFPALVRIHVVTTDAYNGRLAKYEGSGSGVVIDAEGHVVTNHHVAGKARRLVCRMPDGEEIEARLVGSDPLADIAVLRLKMEKRPEDAPALRPAAFGDSDSLRIGDVVLAMGSPSGLTQSVTRGVVSNTAMIMPSLFWPHRFKLDGEDTGTLVRWIGHDARISGGNSGGPLVNLDGEIVGINEVGIGGLGGAIPANLARSVAEQLIESGEVRRSWIGLGAQARLESIEAERGVLVGSVVEDSPADAAGLEPGDIILKFDGVEVDARIDEDLPLFNRLVLATPIGKEVEVQALRGGEPQRFTLTTRAGEKARGEDEELKNWGITARDFTLMSALENRREDQRGVQVSSLREGGPAAEAKPALEPEDVILEVEDEAIENLAALRALSERLTSGSTDQVPVLVRFDRNEEELMTVVRIGKEPEKEKPRLARKPWFSASTQVLTSDLAEALDLEGQKGVRVTLVFPGDTAEAAGLEVGDIVTAIDGMEIEASRLEDNQLLPAMVRQYKIGTEVQLDILRGGEPMQLSMTLEAPPTPDAELDSYKDEYFELTLREMSELYRVTRGIDPAVEGVLVDSVLQAGWAALAQVALGDILMEINGVPTPDVATARERLEALREERPESVIFFVRRGIHTLYLELEPDWDSLAD